MDYLTKKGDNTEWKLEEPIADREDENGLMVWGNGLGNHNYCRNPKPDAANQKPWCFTEDPTVGKEACNIEECPANARKFAREASELGAYMSDAESVEGYIAAQSKECLCAAQSFGASATFLQQESRMGQTKDGKPCFCHQ